MAEAVTLPSGLVLDLEPASIRRLLATGEPLGIDELADACLGRASVGVGLLDESDAFYVAEYCVAHLPDDPDATTLAVICSRYCETPSVRLGIADGVLAFEADARLTNLLSTAGDDEMVPDDLPVRETDPWRPEGTDDA